MKIGNIDRARHEDLWPSEQAAALRVMIVGCGAIGSWAGTIMGKMGVRKFWLVDMDRVEDVNISVQAFGVLAIGNTKVQALKDSLVRDSECDEEDVKTMLGRWEAEMAVDVDVCVASMDNLPGRQAVWEAMKGRCGLFVDPRMGGQFLEVHAVEKGDKVALEEYKKVIYPASLEFAEEPCAARAVAYTAAMAGAQVANVVRQWAMKEEGRIKTFMFDIVKGKAWTQEPGAVAKMLRDRAVKAEVGEAKLAPPAMLEPLGQVQGKV